MPERSSPVLEVHDLEVRYGPVSVVRGLDLTLNRGEVLGLIGANGAGKSSTLAAIAGTVRPRHGDIRLEGESITDLAIESRVARGLALVPEGRHIFPSFTVEENVRLGVLGRRDRDGAEEALEWVHGLFPIVHDFRRRVAGELSGGQQQQLALARALVSGPDVLLLDEPSLGLAPSVAASLIDALAAIRDRGVSILLVEQRAQSTVAFADRTHVLRGGRMVLTLTPDDAADVDRMTAAYFGT
jgi:branched-chain amino acid transport system ATP-binding protein